MIVLRGKELGQVEIVLDKNEMGNMEKIPGRHQKNLGGTGI